MILTSTFVEKCQQKMRAYVRKHDMLLGKESVLIAVSGGADSMALLEMVSRLAPLLKLQVGIAHFDHELRGEESRKDSAFVNEQARERGLKIFIGRAEVQRLAAEQKLSLEDAARKARYQFLERVARRHGYSIVLTGHTADDNAETLLMNLLRGSGVTGLAGIPPVRSLGRGLILARPLLWAGRSEIREFVQQAGIQWREDESNQNTRFLRNRVRQELLPALQQFNPSIVSTLNSTADIMRGVEQHLGHSVRTAIEQVTAPRNNNEPRNNDVVELNLNQLKHLLPAIQSELVQRVVCQRFELPPIPHSAVERTMGLVWKETGSKAEIIDGISALRDRETLVIRRDPPPFIPFERSFDTGTTTETGKARLITRRMKNSNIQFSNNRSIEFIDADRLPKKLTLRSWREGDRFQPLGMDGEKKISDFLIDEKVALDAKRDVLVLADEQNIIWVCGMRLDERYRITPETQNVLRIEFIQLRRQPEQGKPANTQQQSNGQQFNNGQKQQQQPKPTSQAQQQKQQKQQQPQGNQQGQAAQPGKQQQPTGVAQTKPQGNQPQRQQPAQQQQRPQQSQGNQQPQQQRPQQPAGVAQTKPQGNQPQRQQSAQQQQRPQQPQGNQQPQQQRPQQQPTGPAQTKPQGNQPQQQQPKQQGNQPQQQRPQQPAGVAQTKPQGNQPQRQQSAQQQQRPQQPQGNQQPQQQRPAQQPTGTAQAKPQGNQPQRPQQPAGVAQAKPQGNQSQRPQQENQPQQQRPQQPTGVPQNKPQGNQPQRQQPAQQQQRPQQPQQQRPTEQRSGQRPIQPQQPPPAAQQTAAPTEQRPVATQPARPTQPKAAGPGRRTATPQSTQPATPQRLVAEAPSTSPAPLPPAATATVGAPAVAPTATPAAKRPGVKKLATTPTAKTGVAEQAQPSPEPAAKRPAKKSAATASKASKPQVAESTSGSAPAPAKRAATRKSATPKPPAANHGDEHEGNR